MHKKLLLYFLFFCLPLAVQGQSIEVPDLSGLPQPTQAKALRYWFNDDTEVKIINQLSGQQTLDVSELLDGLHTLNYQVICSDGTPACIYTSIFMKTKGSLEEGNVKASRLLYWFDDNTEIKHADMTQSIQLLDASELHDGLHTLHYQVQCENGDVTPVMSAIFMRLSIDVTATSAKSLRYWFDDDASTVNVISVANGTQTLNVADFPIGMHTLNYQLIDSNGNVTPTVTRMFLKQFDKVLANSHNGIVKYEYWLNEHSTAMQSIMLADAPNPYTLIALLPMQKEPLNTLNFHYEANNGNPMIYAKNEFHIRFHDAAGYWVDESKPFIDYSIYKEVNPVGEISATQTFPKVAQNDIRWYTMQSLPGDTAAFKLSQPATIQVFAPSGEEVFKTSAAESVKWDGIHTWEDGTYYIAVHDVTGSQSTMKLEYMHMDKYDVVDWNVRKVGNGGCSTITFKGNGFRDLYAVDLHGPGGEIISSINVGYISDAETAVSFDFTGARIGEYSAVFHFAEEDKRFAGIVTVEEAKDLTFDIDVQYPRTFLSGTYANYTISVTNKGNATAYDVPLELRLRSEGDFSEIKSIELIDDEGRLINSSTLEDMNLELDSLDEEGITFYEEILEQFNRLQKFMVVKDSVTNKEFGYINLYLTIAPDETLIFNVKLKSSSSVTLEAQIPTEWICITSYNDNEQKRNSMKRSPSQNKFCCYKDAIQCSMDVVSNVVGILPVLGCLDIFKHHAETIIGVACSGGNSFGDKMYEYFSSMYYDSDKYSEYRNDALLSILSCVAGKLADKALRALTKLKRQIKKIEEVTKVSKTKLDQTNSLLQKARADKTALTNEIYEKEMEANRLFASGDKTAAKEAFDEVNLKKAELERLNSKINSYELEINVLEVEISNYEKEIGDLNKAIEDARLEKIKAKNSISDWVSGITNAYIAYKEAPQCIETWNKALSNCSPNKRGGGTSSPVNSCEPNDIYGYLSPSGSKFIAKDSVETVNYRIEFENDPIFATSAAHVVDVRDTLDARYFDLSTFVPTYFTIAGKREQLDGTVNFVRTVDMRPKINTIVQVKCMYEEHTGAIRWLFTSLDPITIEPVKDVMQGFLPVNTDGISGIGDVGYRIGLNKGLADGTEIPNRASNIFDYNDPVPTPTWINIVDAVAPTSTISDLSMLNDTTIHITADAYDARSGVWKYEWYVQCGEDAPWWKEGETDTLCFDYRIYEDIDYGFCVLATDSAGNVEQKVLLRESRFKIDEYGNVETYIETPKDSGGNTPPVIYDLSGRRLTKPQENRINIIGRKKVLYRKYKQ